MDAMKIPDPLHVFRFAVEFEEAPLSNPDGQETSVNLCHGAFSECSGLEATMEPKAIVEGGRNYGAVQRAGPVTFSTVILKRGITSARHLWQWFELVNRTSAYTHRLTVTITLLDGKGEAQVSWQLRNAMPVKFKSPDLSATNGEVGIEELHFVHEGFEVSRAAASGSSREGSRP